MGILSQEMDDDDYARRLAGVTLCLVVEELQLMGSVSAVIYAVNASSRLKREYEPPVGIMGDGVTRQSDRATSRIAKVGQTGQHRTMMFENIMTRS